MERLKKSTIEVVPSEEYIPSIKCFVFTLIGNQYDKEKLENLVSPTLDKVLKLVMEKSRTLYGEVPLTLTIEKRRRGLFLKMINKGTPLFFLEEKEIALMENIKEKVDFFNFKNLGRKGQQITIGFRFSSPKEFRPLKKVSVEKRTPTNEIKIRLLQKGEEGKLTELFYTVYNHNYIHEYIYYPQRIRKMIQDNKLISLVAEMGENEPLVGHVGLVKINSNPVVYEAALGVVNPEIKAQGLFSKLFHQTIEISSQTPMQYCVFDFVTNHDYSQRQVYKYQSCEMCIMVGGQVSTNQAKLERIGIGKDPQETDRYSILLAIRPMVPAPFGLDIVLPVNLGEMAEFLLTPLGIRWTPASRFSPLPIEGKYSMEVNEAQKSVRFDFRRPGKDALWKIIEDWRYHLKIGYQYASIDIPLDHPGIGQLYDFFTRNHFFISGFIPYNFSSRLGLRLQSLAPTRVNFDEIHLFSENAKRLLSLIKKDFERTNFI